MPSRQQIEEMLQAEPEDVFLNYALAMQHVSDGDAEAGLAGLERVLALDGDYVAAWFQKGQLQAQQGDVDAARTTLREGIAVAHKVNDSHAAGEMTEFLESLG